MANKHAAIDRAIRAYNKAYDVPDDWPIRDTDREAFRAGVAELLLDMDEEDADPCCQWSIGWGQALAEIKRRAGSVEGEG